MLFFKALNSGVWRLIDGRVIPDIVKDFYSQIDSEDEDAMILRKILKFPSKDRATYLFIYSPIHSLIYLFIYLFIHYVVSLRQVHSLFQIVFPIDCDLVLPLPVPSNLSFP
jgi:hypothetical protein